MTVAERGPPSISAISPKKSPGPRARDFPSTRARPSRMRYREFPRSPAWTMTSFGSQSTRQASLAIARTWRFGTPANSGSAPRISVQSRCVGRSQDRRISILSEGRSSVPPAPRAAPIRSEAICGFTGLQRPPNPPDTEASQGSRIFQKLSLRTIFPSSPNVHRSQPRTSIRSPDYGRARDRPLRHAAVPAGEVVVVSVGDVRNALEARGKPAPDLVLPDEPAAPAARSPRGLEDTILAEVLHDRVEVVSVEGAEHLLKDFDPAIVGHDLLLSRRPLARCKSDSS